MDPFPTESGQWRWRSYQNGGGPDFEKSQNPRVQP